MLATDERPALSRTFFDAAGLGAVRHVLDVRAELVHRGRVCAVNAKQKRTFFLSDGPRLKAPGKYRQNPSQMSVAEQHSATLAQKPTSIQRHIPSTGSWCTGPPTMYLMSSSVRCTSPTPSVSSPRPAVPNTSIEMMGEKAQLLDGLANQLDILKKEVIVAAGRGGNTHRGVTHNSCAGMVQGK